MVGGVLGVDYGVEREGLEWSVLRDHCERASERASIGRKKDFCSRNTQEKKRNGKRKHMASFIDHPH